MRSPDPTLRHALRQVHRGFMAVFTESLEQVELTESGYTVLFTLRRIPDMSNADLARWLGVTAQGANQLLKPLVEAGLVVRKPSRSHGRILETRLTDAGERVIAFCEAEADKAEATMTSLMTPEEVTEFERLLRKAAVGLNRPVDEPVVPSTC